jgi:hypothetical protein
MAFNIKYVYNLVDDISPKLEKIKRNINKAAQNVRESANKMANSFDNIKKKLDKVGSKAKEVGKSLFLKLTVPVGFMGGVAIKAASDFEESMNKVDVAFGNAAKGVKDFASIAGKDFGIDRGTALDMAAMFGDMSTSMGLSEDMASTLSQKLVGLSGDLASFKNINVEQATTALAGVFTGETESLKRLGVVMTETNLKQFAMEKGITKNLKQFTQAEKVLLRYQFVMSKTRNAQGDFLRTNEGFANQMRILSSNINELKISFGSILLPIATKIVNVVSKLAIKFNELNPTTKKIIAVTAVLAAALAPVLIAIGFMIPAISALAAGFKVLTAAMLGNPIGLIVTGIGLAIIGIIKLKSLLNEMGFTLKDIPKLVLDSFQRNFPILTKVIRLALAPLFAMKDLVMSLFDIAGNAANFIGGKIEAAKNFLGFGDKEQVTNINQNQNSNLLEGRVDLNFNNIPKGTNVVTNMGGNTNVSLGTNEVYGSAL